MNGGENSEGWRAKFCKFLKCFCECFEKKGGEYGKLQYAKSRS